MNVDQYNNNIQTMNQKLNSIDVDLNTVSNINKMLKTNKENLEKDIKNNIIYYRYFLFNNINRNEVNEGIKKIPTSNDDKKQLNSIVSNNTNFKKGIEKIFDQFIKIKSFVENETNKQNENLSRLIIKCEAELQEIKNIEYDKKIFDSLKSKIESTRSHISNLTLSSIYENKYVLSNIYYYHFQNIEAEYKTIRNNIIKMIKEELYFINTIHEQKNNRESC